MPSTHTAPSYDEWTDSQAPALALLERLGWTILSAEESVELREGSRSRVLLEPILRDALQRINRIEYRGETYLFSDANVARGVEALRAPEGNGLMQINEGVYGLLTLGKSLEQEIGGDRSSFNLKYIDWDDIENNDFHVVPEFYVQGPSCSREPDLVLFVNGIPLVVIECKRRDGTRTIAQALSQSIRNQTVEKGVPRLFHYAQLLMAVQPNEARYGTVGTPAPEYNIWEEPDEEVLDRLLAPLLADENGSRLPTVQDRTLWSLCSIPRLMELVQRFIIFEGHKKIIARYRQYFNVKRTMERILTREADGRRKGGVIWSSTGSGKSVEMVMLARNILLTPAIVSPRLVLVNDQVDLDKQLKDTFVDCGIFPVRATTGAHLLDLLEDPGNQVITTVIHKFDAGLKRRSLRAEDPNIFVLVDESHRTQYGTLHARMRKVLPNACMIGYTGTPLTGAEKSTAEKFGGIISAYPIHQAVEDGVVLPLSYQGRDPIAEVNRKQIDRGFDRIAESLSEYEATQLKGRYAREREVFRSQQVIEEIAADITRHYVENWQGTGLKGMIATSDKMTAIRYHNYFEKEGKVKTAVVISGPDKREGFTDADAPEGMEDEESPDAKKVVLSFWDRMMTRYGTEEKYVDRIISEYKNNPRGIELLIVVDKLLVGFNAPRTVVLYLTKALKGHALIQAISRVNRLYSEGEEGSPGHIEKDFGFIVDYRGVLGNLDHALNEYRELAEYDAEDLEGLLSPSEDAIGELPQLLSDLWDLFRGVENRADKEALERYLHDEKLRDRFYRLLSLYSRTLARALSTEKFHEEPEETIERHRKAHSFFQSLRQAVRDRYAETTDFTAYEPQIRKLMDRHVHIDEVVSIAELADIFNEPELAAEAARVTGSSSATPASKADRIAHRTKRTLNERMDQDPVLYRKFSEMLQETIDMFHAKRLDELEYLQKVSDIAEQVENEEFRGIPAELMNRPEARAIFNTLESHITRPDGMKSDAWKKHLTGGGIAIEEIIETHRIVDWWDNRDVEKKMRNDIEDYLLEIWVGERDFDTIDRILDDVLRIARSRR